MAEGDEARGLYGKYHVSRVDGRKKAGSAYFILDYGRDFHAIPALQAYADSVRDLYPKLAADLDEIVRTASDCNRA